MTLFLITAPSGAGKTTLCKKINHWTECVSHTTRPMRDGEKDGETYYFVSKEEFNEMDEQGGFAEKVEYDGNYYGVSVNELQSKLKDGKIVYIIVEYDGYKQIKEKYPEAIGIFVYMSKEECMANMLLRGDSLENAISRIEKYDSEMKNRKEYDYVIKNVRDKFLSTTNIMENIISANFKR